ncbi:MAG TPA: hypothetical protein VJ875_06495 [Pyrinomonadaceae bacterium]|nr:hypothetical protein [Pyrinomonadaceae bacterium]
MGTQDNGSFASLEAGAVTPTWTKRDGGDIFDIVADNLHVVSTQFCCLTSPGSRVFVRDPGDTDGGEISNYPLGIVPPFKFSDVIVRFGPTRYALIMNDPGSVIGGAAFSTLDITRKPVLWTSLGVSLNTACALWVAGLPTNPTFYAAAGGFCPSFGDSRGFLNRFTGLSTTGQWHSGILPGPSQMVSAFAIDPNNTNRLIASQVIAGGARILRSSDGGTTWVADPVLEGLMTGGGIFRMQTLRYVQPSLLAFDPNDSNTLLAGAVDAGIFLSRNNGATWVALTNNSGDVSNPVIPYPHAAYFDRECGKKNIYVATRGRGVWRFSYDDPAAVSVSKCQSGCDVSLTDCQNECDKLRNECMNETGPGKRLPSQCAELRNTCRATCTNTRDACRQRCTTCPE